MSCLCKFLSSMGDSNNGETFYNRLGECEVCGDNNAQYTCPRCDVKTCSLPCVKIHKKELDCSGDRDKVGYVPLSKFTNLTLLSDYRLLEDISRTIDTCKRNPLKKYTRYNKGLPTHLYRLRKAAGARKTNIQFLPQHFTRHQENTSILQFNTNTIYWRLDLVFYLANNLKVVVEKCDENEKLSVVVSKFIDFDKCPNAYKKQLKFYHSTGLSGVDVLLMAEGVKEKPSFFILDMFSTLRENFENRIIIEYPVLYVIFKTHKDEFTILDSDVEVECALDRSKNGQQLANFNAFHYFDTVKYTKKSSQCDDSIKKINSCAIELRKYFSGDRSDDEVEADKCVEIKSEKPIKLNIPFYENLIKQN